MGAVHPEPVHNREECSNTRECVGTKNERGVDQWLEFARSVREIKELNAQPVMDQGPVVLDAKDKARLRVRPVTVQEGTSVLS